MIHSADTTTASPAPQTESVRAHAGETVRIRKYPNRRLYDTSRSRHVTQQEVLDLVTGGRTVEVTDSRTGADITNAVLLQIVIDRDAARLVALPSALVHWAARTGTDTLAAVASDALRLANGNAKPAPEPITSRPQPSLDTTARLAPAAPGTRLKAQKLVR